MIRRLATGPLLRVLQLLDRLLQLLVPPRRDQLAWMSDPDYIGSAHHLYRHALRTRPGLRHVWLVADDDARARVEADLARWAGRLAPGARVAVRHRQRPAGYWAALRSRWVVHTHGTYPMTRTAARGRQVVSLWHGMPIKAIGALNRRSPNPHPTFGTLHVATSPSYRPIIAAAFRAPEADVLLTALPRCDVLARPDPLGPAAAEVRAALGLAADRRLILWTPTYRSFAGATAGPEAGARTFLDDLPSGFVERLADAADRHGCEVVVKLHPQDPLNGRAHEVDLGPLRLVTARAWLATGFELYDLVALADALVTDVSSLLVDWLATDRPLGIVGFDPATYPRDVVVDVARITGASRVHDLTDPEQLEDLVARAGAGRPCGREDDLSGWLSAAPAGEGCETVLGAMGLGQVNPVAGEN